MCGGVGKEKIVGNGREFAGGIGDGEEFTINMDGLSQTNIRS